MKKGNIIAVVFVGFVVITVGAFVGGVIMKEKQNSCILVGYIHDKDVSREATIFAARQIMAVFPEARGLYFSVYSEGGQKYNRIRIQNERGVVKDFSLDDLDSRNEMMIFVHDIVDK